ncbi:sce7725 family protein [Lacticaseibacillus brantae]|uniref:Sce7725 family protein n=1 Tax=Lacticaseibacillus brantae DSM 23927 TaxID=1423727 RepID=A0A0R2AX15_9LACO|nr:sce7725 family protein [Lacticaseibacillus brantae]KRM71349.1 hypothetical protein FC34_GL001829 [Lacticaseibacillus brantae DSM 23927]
MKYFPFIRGKQFDLAALTELAQRQLISPQVIPIVEPVKDSPGLTKLGDAFVKSHLPLAVVTNPQVGNYGLLEQPIHAIKLQPPLLSARYFEPDNHAQVIIAQTVAQAQLLRRQSGIKIVPNTAVTRQLALSKAVFLTDRFTIWGHTEDYRLVQDEFYQFGPDQLPGLGFSDYPLTSGHYSEQGYPQRALALHLVYPEHGHLRLHHFVSVNNDDYANPQAKFLEAASQLTPWLTSKPQADSFGLRTLIDLADDQHFPGMGVLRKLQLMHHLEIINRFLSV